MENHFSFYDTLPYHVYVIECDTNDIVYTNIKDHSYTQIISCLSQNKSNEQITYDKFCAFDNKWYQVTEKMETKNNKRYKHYIAVDITEYKNNTLEKEKLLQESRLSAMSEMIDMLSHQWRQPLTAININAQSLKLKGQLNKLSTDSINMLSDSIIKVVKELSDTIADFNYVFKSSNSKKETQLNTQIQKVVELNSELLKENGINVTFDLQSTKTISLNQKDFTQVILRIFTNAIEAFEKEQEEKQIIIKSFDIDNTSQIEIIDNGRGIPDEILSKIYEPYFSTKSYNKKGLGLYFAKVLATEHLNAIISVDNKDKTKFIIKFLEG